jgi:hypothetical protein
MAISNRNDRGALACPCSTLLRVGTLSSGVCPSKSPCRISIPSRPAAQSRVDIAYLTARLEAVPCKDLAVATRALKAGATKRTTALIDPVDPPWRT